MSNQIVFIPGLGDDNSVEMQKKLIKRWNKKGRDLTIFYPKWHTNETYKDKYARLLATLPKDKFTVVGASAGTSLALTLLGNMPDRVVDVRLIAGKFRNPQYIGQNYQKRAPAFLESVQTSQKVLNNLKQAQLSKITSYRSIFDGVIRTSEMNIKGAKNVLIPIVGHVPSIVVALISIRI